MYPKLKKSLGQNFLVDKNVSSKIISLVSRFRQSQSLLEIGPGSGLLTDKLIDIYAQIYAIEIDKRMCEILNQKFSNNPHVNILHKDILKTNINGISADKIDIFGNIPYYITGPIFMHIFKHRARVNTIFITIQKELATRLKADCGSKDFGFFSCLVQYFTEIEDSFDIKRNSFLPAPKVDSTFLVLKVKKIASGEHEETNFIKIIKNAFGQRRKTIANALSREFGKERAIDFLKESGIDPGLRPEDIELNSYIKLAKLISQ